MHQIAYLVTHIGFFALALIVLSMAGLIILGAMYFSKYGMSKYDRWIFGDTGNWFQGPTEWADINEAADRAHQSICRREEE